MIVDNSPESYMLQPENAIPIKPFFGDESDAEMQALTAFLKDVVEGDVPDVRVMLARWVPEPETLDPRPQNLNPKPPALKNPKSYTLNPKPRTQIISDSKP